jgi:hypothetical protein
MNKLLKYCILVGSIGFSDLLEYFINPAVHKIHNCPDIIKKSWNNYTFIDAFMSGILCAWFLFLVVLIFSIPDKFVLFLLIINILMPLLTYNQADIFMCHKLLYFVNFIVIIIGIIYCQIYSNKKI